MGIMADGTIAIRIGRMLDANLAARLHGGGMTVKTKGAALDFQQFRLLRGMRGMAGDTGLVTCDRGMGKGNLLALGVMAFHT